MKKIIALFLVLSLCIGVTSCGGKKTANGDSVHVKWYLFTSSADSDNTEAFANAAKIAKDKLNVDLELVGMNSSSYESKIQVFTASNEEFDIMYASNWMNDYYQNVSRGALIPLDDLLKDTPDLKKSIPDYWWDAVKINGKIYGVPNQQIACKAPCYAIPTQNIKSMGLDMSKADTEYTDYKELLNSVEDYAKQVKEKTGRYTFFEGGMWSEVTMYGMEELLGSGLPGAVRYNKEGKIEVINQYESEEYLYALEKSRQWVLDGLKQPNDIDSSEKRIDEYLGDGKVAPWINKRPTYKPGLESGLKTYYDVDMSVLFKTKPILSSSGLCATINGVSVTSKHPDAALKVLELANTDRDFFNAVAYGKEGVQYEKVGDNHIKKIANPAYNVYSWAVGNVFNGYLVEGDADDTWEKTKEMNESAKRSPLIGFNVDPTKIKSKIANCKSVIDEYSDILDSGTVDYKPIYDKFIAKLKAAGCDDIIKELQSQVDKWQSAK